MKAIRGEKVGFCGDIPLVFYPLGFETYTSSYTREGQTLPEVT